MNKKEIKWTKNKPTKPGWYWWKCKEWNYDPQPVAVREWSDSESKTGNSLDVKLFSDNYSFRNMEQMAGEWNGPIKPPDTRRIK